jgi:hypothetical protein
MAEVTMHSAAVGEVLGVLCTIEDTEAWHGQGRSAFSTREKPG